MGLGKVATNSIKSAPTHCWWFVMLVSIAVRASPKGLQWEAKNNSRIRTQLFLKLSGMQVAATR